MCCTIFPSDCSLIDFLDNIKLHPSSLYLCERPACMFHRNIRKIRFFHIRSLKKKSILNQAEFHQKPPDRGTWLNRLFPTGSLVQTFSSCWLFAPSCCLCFALLFVGLKHRGLHTPPCREPSREPAASHSCAELHAAEAAS